MNQSLSRSFTFGQLVWYALPSIIMMVFMSLYTIVDGFFVARFVSTDALSAINIVYPVINLILGVSIMLATGGSAVVARLMGEGRHQEARENFSLLVVTGVIAGVVISAAGLLFTDPIIRLLGGSGELLPLCRSYLQILLLFAPAYILQMLFQAFTMTAGKPALGMISTILAGVVNGILDYLLIVPLGMGIAGAALATAAGYLVPAAIGIVFFIRNKEGLHFAKPKFRSKVLRQSCLNGSSEMVTNLSTSVVTFLFNILMLHYLGSDGVASITIVLYTQFLMTAVHLGFSLGVAPVISYNYGCANHTRLQTTFRSCMLFTLISSVLVFAVSLAFPSPIVSIFSAPGSRVYDITIHGFVLFSINYLFSGVNIFSSAFFTALSNGKISAIISFLRTFVFLVAGMLLLPTLLGVDGIWLSVPLAELLTVFISVFYLRGQRKTYHYAWEPHRKQTVQPR